MRDEFYDQKNEYGARCFGCGCEHEPLTDMDLLCSKCKGRS